MIFFVKNFLILEYLSGWVETTIFHDDLRYKKKMEFLCEKLSIEAKHIKNQNMNITKLKEIKNM